MTDLQENINLAEKLQWASPVPTPPSGQVDLSGSAAPAPTAPADKTSAFLNDSTIENQISNISQTTAPTQSAGVDLSAYNPVAAAQARQLAEENARKQNEELQTKAKAQQREKIAQFLKWQSAKDRRIWYAKWMFAGIFFTVFALFILSLFFKNDVIAFIDKDPNEYLDSTSKLATQLICDNVELPEEIKLTNDETTNNIANLENMLAFWNKLLSNYSDKILTSVPSLRWVEASNVSLVSYSKTNNQELNIEESHALEESAPTYTLSHVNSIEEANRVISADCNELSCWDYTQAQVEDIVLCEQFRQKEDMENDTPRIWHSGTCRYKDESELAYLSLE